jgi:hypothetical protein
MTSCQAFIDRTRRWSGTSRRFPWCRCRGDVDVEYIHRSGAQQHQEPSVMQLVKGEVELEGDAMAVVSGILHLLFLFRSSTWWMYPVSLRMLVMVAS